MIQIIPDHDGQGVGPGGRLLHPLQGPSAAASVSLWANIEEVKHSPGCIIIDAVPADHGSAAVDLEAEESQHQQRYEGWRHAETDWRWANT